MEQTQRKKLELELNEPRTLQLLFDNPLVGESRHGVYWLYALVDIATGEEYSFFAPHEGVHAELSKFNAGDNVQLLKSARQSGKKVITTYTVTPANGGPLKSTIHDTPSNGNGKAAAGDALFEVLERCYADAIKMQERFNGMVDVNRIAITLFIARSRTNGHNLAANLT